MVDIYIEMIKRDIAEALQTPGITFDQVHYLIRQSMEKLWNHDSKYETVIKKYYEDEQVLLEKIRELSDGIAEVRKSIASIDEKMYEAIKKL